MIGVERSTVDGASSSPADPTDHPTPTAITGLLRDAGLLDELTPEQQQLAVRLFRPARFAFGDELCRTGDPDDALFVLVHGQVRVLRFQDGHEDPIGRLGPGDAFGTRGPMAASAGGHVLRASSAVDVLVLGADGVVALAGLSPAFARRLDDRPWPTDEPLAHGRGDRSHAAPSAGPVADVADATDGPHASQASQASSPDPGSVTSPPARERSSWHEGLRRRTLRRRDRRFPFVPQYDENDCGAACVAMIARHHGRAASLTRIRDAAASGQQGSSLTGIVQGGAAIGLDVTPYRISPDREDALALPAIIHWEDRHWVVLVALGPGHAVIADPATGVRRITRHALAASWSGYAASVRTTEALHDAPIEAVSLRWIVPFLKAHRGALGASLVLALLAAAGEVGIPVVAQQLVDRVSAGTADLHGLGAALIGLVVGAVAFRFAQRRLLVRTAVRLDASMIDFVTARLLGLPLAYFSTRRTGDLERRVVGMAEVRRVVVQQGIEAITAVVLLAATVTLMFVYSWPLALAFCLVLPVYGCVMRWSTTRLRPIFAAMEEAFGQYLSSQVDLLKGIETVKGLGAEPGLRRRMQVAFDRLRQRIEPGYQAMAGYDVAVWAIGLATYAAVVYLGGVATAAGRLTLGQYVAFMALVLLCIPPTTTLLQAWDDVQLSSVLLARIHDVIAREPERTGPRTEPSARHANGPADGAAVAAAIEGRLTARGVGVHTTGGTTPILADIDLDVEPGMTVALVGRSGSGKTTLLRVLAGMVEPTEGRVEWDATDLRDADLQRWRTGIGVALQSPYLFDCSLEDNVRFDRPDLGPEALARAIEVASLTDLVADLPLGVRTPIGEGGLLLSGGEAQRVALARAVYGDPAVLFLDEATSALDAETERQVTVRLRRVQHGRTTIVATHRLETIRDADLIVTLDHGRIVERGTHDELVNRAGVYAHLVRLAGQGPNGSRAR